ncbi:MAG TPA: O-antigen ligase family protein [Longimicrobiaceae bacterium]|jgi:hypothetical protein|nr:O-antigen ligase family protein [Longimicrobiaceae bacterium]
MPETAAAPAAAGRGVRVAAALRLALVLSIVGQLGRIPVLQAGRKDAPILANDIFLMCVLVLGGVCAFRAKRLLLDRVALVALAFAAVGGISTVLAVPRFGLSGSQVVFSLAYLARWLAYFGIYLVTVNFVRGADVERVWRAFQGTVVAMAAFGIFQAIFLPDFAFMVYPGSAAYLDWDPQGHRLVSTVLDPNFAGAIINMALLPSLAMLSYGVRQRPWMLAVLFLALALTLSRGAILAFVIGVSVIVLARGVSRRLVRVMAVLPLAVLPFIPFLIRYAILYRKLGIGDKSALGRFAGWLIALRMIRDHPVIGVGFNTFGFVSSRWDDGVTEVISRSSFGGDGGLLLVTVLTGGVGLCCFLWMLGAAVANCRRTWRNASAPPMSRGLAAGVAAVTVAIVIHGFFLNTLFYPFIMEPLWVLWGLAFVARRSLAARAPSPEAPARPRFALAHLGGGALPAPAPALRARGATA